MIKKEFIAPILALSLICLVMAGALSLVNGVTSPVIAEAAAERADEARRSIKPLAREFTALDTSNLPSTIIYAHKAVGNDGETLGYTFIVSTKGFGGDMRIICGIDMDGKIISSEILSNSETISFLNRVTAFRDTVEDPNGRNESFVEVGPDALSGATVTYNAYWRALTDAVSAFKIISQGGGGK
jgi:electron transport complex protein RnfG